MVNQNRAIISRLNPKTTNQALTQPTLHQADPKKTKADSGAMLHTSRRTTAPARALRSIPIKAQLMRYLEALRNAFARACYASGALCPARRDLMQRLLRMLGIGIIIALTIGFLSDVGGKCTRTEHYGSMQCTVPWR